MKIFHFIASFIIAFISFCVATDDAMRDALSGNCPYVDRSLRICMTLSFSADSGNRDNEYRDVELSNIFNC